VDGDEDWLVMIPLRHGQILARTGRWTEALEVARQVDQQFGEFPQRYELDYLLGRCWMSQAQMSTARDHFRRVVDSPIGGHTETAAMAQWMIGETYFLQKNYDEALRAYHRVESLFGYRRWQAAALLQAGKCREMKRQAPQAIELYRQVAEQFADTRFAKQAVERLQALGERNIP
jgi:cellulose synthase operon protein C